MAKKKTQLTKEEERQAYEAIRPQLAAAFQFAQEHLNFGMDDWEWNSHIHASTIYKVLKGSLKTCKPCVIGMGTLKRIVPSTIREIIRAVITSCLVLLSELFCAEWLSIKHPRSGSNSGLTDVSLLTIIYADCD